MYIFVENYFYVSINNSHFFYSCSVPYPEDFGKILNEFEYKAVNVFNLILHVFPKLLVLLICNFVVCVIRDWYFALSQNNFFDISLIYST
jgi:hypothetical protein